MKNLLLEAKTGFKTLKLKESYKKAALKNLALWLTKEEFKDYVPQIKHLITKKHWEYLLDSFYQVIPFGTGGRRGEVGIGPNRINPWTIKASAQGHSQYLLKKHGVKVKNAGVVFAYDVREFNGNQYLDNALKNPVKNLKSVDLAKAAAEVYAANGIKVYMFNGIRTTPELSFAVRYLKAAAGDVFSASHNPPDHNGKKLYDEFGGQLIPPDDEILVKEVTQKVKTIKHWAYQKATGLGLIVKIKSDVDEAYLRAAAKVSRSSARNINITYTSLHGCGLTSVYKVLKNSGFKVKLDTKTSRPSGRFENITFNIPNPEVVESFDTTLKFAQKNKSDLIISSDPDADRIGLMVKHKKDWVFLNGNEIATILVGYAATKNKGGLIVKTVVTTDLIKNICAAKRLQLTGDLLVGFKYIAAELNKLEKKGKNKNFLLGAEESNGYLGGDYARDKDAAGVAVWLAELAAELKKNKKTLIDYLNNLYSEYGYFRNYLTEVRILGAIGQEKINHLQKTLRNNPPKKFGNFKVKKFEDYLKHKPLVSGTDRVAKNMLVFHLTPLKGVNSIKVTIRPSGTEPKTKIYFEIGTKSVASSKLTKTKAETEKLLNTLEKSVMTDLYRLIGVDFPERGFLLFWQLPLNDKLKYFQIEPQIENLRKEINLQKRREQLFKLLSFLGSNPLEKIDKAFIAKNKKPILKYLRLNA